MLFLARILDRLPIKNKRRIWKKIVKISWLLHVLKKKIKNPSYTPYVPYTYKPNGLRAIKRW